MHESIDFAAVARTLLAGAYTTKSLGDAIGLSQPAVSRLARGKTRDVSALVGLRLIELGGGKVVAPPPAYASAEVSNAG